MQLTRIMVEGVGRFGTAVEVAGLGEGVNILSADNEAGKSTLFRALRTCLFERHRTRGSSVAALATEGLSLPVTIALSFNHEGHSYDLHKSFLKSPSARLSRNGVLLARDSEADEQVWELLGITPGTSRLPDEAAFGLLWVGQCQSLIAPAPSEAATATLNQAIQDEVGSLVGGERARLLLAELRDTLGKTLTEKGKARAGSPLGQAQQQLLELEEACRQTEERLQALEQQLTARAAKQADRLRLTDPVLTEQLRNDLENARRDLKAGEDAQTRLSQYEATENTARSTLERASEDLRIHEERASRIDQDRVREQSVNARLTPLEAETAGIRNTLSALNAEREALLMRETERSRREKQLKALETAHSRQAERETMLRRRAALKALGERLTTNEAALAGNAATAKAIADLNRIEHELAMAEARREAAAPQVSITLADKGKGRVFLNDVALPDSASHPVIDALAIRIDDLATITITPPTAQTAQGDAALAAARTALQGLLDATRSPTAAALRQAHAQRLQLEAEAATLRTEAATWLESGATTALLHAEIARLDTALARISTAISDALAQAELEALPSTDHIAQQLQALQTGHENDHALQRTLGTRIAAQHALLTEQADTRGQLVGMLAEIRSRLAGDLAVLPDSERASRHAALMQTLETARTAHHAAAAALEGQRRLTPGPDDLERHRIRMARMDSALRNNREALERTERDIAHLDGQIQSAGGDGLGEKLETLRNERDITRQNAEQLQERAATLQLLLDTVQGCYDEHRERLNAPLRRHLHPFLNDVFPTAELELGDGFSIAGLRRSGSEAENFRILSTGTQEQIAVIVRLAMGSMLAGRGHKVPIVLDDALAYSDDSRIEQMFDALNRAGQQQQVIVLTCRSRAFAALGGRPLRITPVTEK